MMQNRGTEPGQGDAEEGEVVAMRRMSSIAAPKVEQSQAQKLLNSLPANSELAETQLSQLLTLATRQADLSEVKIIMESEHGEVIVDRLDDERLSALHYAARNGYHTIAAYLMDYTTGVAGEEGLHPLHLASKAGHKETLDVMLSKRRDNSVINVRDDYGATPLHHIILRGSVECARVLLKSGAQVNAADDQQMTPMHYASMHGRADLVAMFVEDNADLLARDVEAVTPLMLAAQEGHEEVVKKILEVAGTSRDEAVADVDDQQLSALHHAVRRQNVGCARILLQTGATPDAASQDGSTALHLAARTGNAAMAELLLKSPASTASLLGAIDIERLTPLHVAANHGHLRFCEVLFAAGAQVDARDSEDWTPLMYACWKGHVAVVELLLRKKASLLATAAFDDKTAMVVAIEAGKVAVVKLLLEKSPECLDSVDRSDNTVLHSAAADGSVDIISAILATPGAKKLLSKNNEEEMTPLHVAAKNGHVGATELLIKCNNSLLSDEDEASNTPLHLAAQNGHPLTVEVLLGAGAAVDARNQNRWTPLDCAADNGHGEVVRVLVKAHAPIDAVDKNLHTPLHLAARKGHVDTIDVLIALGAGLHNKDNDGLKPLDLAIMTGQMGACERFLEGERWAEAMEDREPLGATATTMGRMIKFLPSAALLVLNRSITTSENVSSEHPDFTVTLNYRYIDAPVSSNKLSTANGEDLKASPLELVAKYNRRDLLQHPIVESLLQQKFHQFGAFSFTLNLLFYGIFLFFLTFYIADNRQTVRATTFNLTGQYVIFCFSLFRIFTEILQIIHQRGQYFTEVANLFEWAVFVLSLIFIFPISDSKEEYQWYCASYAIFFGWVNLVLFVRRFSGWGIYVLMFFETLKSVLVVLAIFILFVIGFALSFFILFQNRYHFSTFGRSFLKTFVMMTGEYEYSSYLPGPGQPFDVRFEVLPYLMFLLFVVVMPIVLMNLLIGLAVDDIQRIMAHAKIERRRMRIQELLPLQRFITWLNNLLPRPFSILLPGKPGESFYRPLVTYMPNQRSRIAQIRRLLLGNLVTDVEEDYTPEAQLLGENRKLRADVRKLQARMAAFAEHQEAQTKIVNALTNAHGLQSLTITEGM